MHTTPFSHLAGRLATPPNSRPAPAPASTPARQAPDEGAIRADERRRIKQILSSPVAAKNIVAACEIACNCDLPASAAIALLGELTAPTPPKTSLAEQILAAGRMARGEIQPPDELPDEPTARKIILAGRRARGEI
jgi:hypothetical protein